MRPVVSGLLIASVALLLFGCASQSLGIAKDRPHAMNEKYGFEGGVVEQRELERRAKAGDAEAANRLGRFYEMVMNDYKTALQWYDLSARFGNKSGAYNGRSLRRVLRDSAE